MKFKIQNTSDKESIKAYIDSLPENHRHDVNIVRYRKKRSLPQNRLYWLWLACISFETGNDKNDLHDEFRKRYLPIKETIVLEIRKKKLTSTTELNSKQFTQYLDKIQIFASAELGIKLPDPTDLYFEQFYEQYKDYI
jgi:hypothetical protein